MRHGRLVVVASLLLGLGAALAAGGEAEFADDFASYAEGTDGAPAWDTTGIAWEVARGRYVASDKARSFAILAKVPYAKRVAVEATVVLRKATGREWKTAGVAVALDERNYWHFAFVEAPEKQGRQHFVELCEMLDGTWLAQSEPATRLTETDSLKPDLDWQYGQPYRLRIELSEQAVSGTLSDADGRVLARRAYKLDNKAVTFGRPALTCGGFEAAFDDVATRSESPVPAPEPQKKDFPPYTQAGRVPLPAEPRGKATGFFHVEEHHGRWWTIDPRGRPFFILGTDHANYRAHWCEKLGYAPYHRNMAAEFGGDETKWAAETAERLLAWGFNALSAGHSPSLRGRGLAWMGFASFGAAFSDVSDLCPKITWTGFPNVFHPKFPAWCDKRAREVCAPFRDDPWLLGYFLDNELEWYGKEHREWSLVDEVFKKPADHTGKQALLDWLKRRYPTVDALNAAWGAKAASYDAIAASAEPLRHATEQGRKDKIDFLRVIAEQYFAIATAAIRRHDPNHMVLGSRFAGDFPPGVGQAAGRHCDIFTINCYRTIDLETEVVHGFDDDLARWHAEVQRPFMITEWSFPALDSGLPCRHGAGMRVDTQAQKARCFTIFQTLLFATPFLVGSNYFMWVDEPAEGISSTFPEDSNYGLVDVHNKPYAELTEAATRLHPQAYAIHAGRVPVLTLRIEREPWRAVIANAGEVAAKTEVEVTVNGKSRRQPIDVPAGKSIEVPLDRLIGETTVSTKEGPHRSIREFEIASQPAAFVRAVVDPDEKLPEATRRDNAATAVHARTDAIASIETPLRAGMTARDIVGSFGLVLSGGAQGGIAGPVVVRLADVPNGAALAKATKGAVASARAEGTGQIETWTMQVDALSTGTELVFRPRALPAFSARAYKVLLLSKGIAPVTDGPPAVCSRTKKGWYVWHHGVQLLKEQPGGNAFDRVVYDDKEFGLFVPVIWQDVGQSLWPKPDTARIAAASVGEERLVMDIEFELRRASEQTVITAVDDEGKRAEQARHPGAFKTCYRFTVYPGKPWFGVRFLWLENTDVRPWKLMAYFHYALSSLAGDASDDEVGGPDVPNYYRRGMAVTWYDPKAKLHYGIAQGRPDDFQMHFWKDPAGGQHADVRREIGVTLKPAERYAEPQPTAYVFGAAGERGSQAWMPIAEEIRRWGAVEVTVLPER